MESDRAQMIRRGFECWTVAANSNDEDEVRAAIAEMMSAYDHDCAIDFTRTLPDLERTTGPEVMVRWMLDARSSLADVSYTPGEIVEDGDTVVVSVHVLARPHGSQASIHMDYAYVFQFRGDKIVTATTYRTVSEALQATTSRVT